MYEESNVSVSVPTAGATARASTAQVVVFVIPDYVPDFVDLHVTIPVMSMGDCSISAVPGNGDNTDFRQAMAEAMACSVLAGGVS